MHRLQHTPLQRIFMFQGPHPSCPLKLRIDFPNLTSIIARVTIYSFIIQSFSLHFRRSSFLQHFRSIFVTFKTFHIFKRNLFKKCKKFENCFQMQFELICTVRKSRMPRKACSYDKDVLLRIIYYCLSSASQSMLCFRRLRFMGVE